MSGLRQRTVLRRAAQSQAQSAGDEASPVDVPPSDDAPASLSLRDRGRLRRRLRFLRRARELQLRDLGGLVFDLYRFGEQREPLVRSKLDAVIATDGELRELEGVLADPRATREVRRPSVGGACRSCNALYPSDASFCSQCGLALTAGTTSAPVDPSTGRQDVPPDQQTREIATPDGWAGTQPQTGDPAPPVSEEET